MSSKKLAKKFGVFFPKILYKEAIKMAKLEKYFFCSDDHKKVIIPEEGKGYCLGGYCYDRAGFPDGADIRTSEIKKIEEEVAITRSGSEYILGEKHPDYVELQKAKERGVPIIDSWKMTGTRNEGYTLIGKIGEEEVKGKVTAQKGNFVYINDTEYYVIWCNWDVEYNDELRLYFTGKYCDIEVFNEFEPYMECKKIRPNLFPNM